MDKEKKTILVSHIDLDGHGVITLARHFNDILKFDAIIARDYGFEDDSESWDFIKTFDSVIITDLSIKQESVEELRELGINVELYDHHSKADWIADDKFSSFDLDRCGTRIFWEDYVKKRIPRYKPILDEFVMLVDTYDMWRQESENWKRAKDLNNVLMGLKNWNVEDPIEQTLDFYKLFENKVKNLSTWSLTRKEREIIERADKREQDVYDRAVKKLQVRVDSKGKLFGVTSMPSKISIVCSRILEDNEGLDYLVAFNTWGGLTGKLSFRSRNGFNCNDIGVANGHDAAAGGQISVENSFVFLENVDYAFTYNEKFDEKDESTIFEKVELA